MREKLVGTSSSEHASFLSFFQVVTTIIPDVERCKFAHFKGATHEPQARHRP